MGKMTLSEELQWRGFINQTTFKSAGEVDKEPLKFYWGVDPSASSMTVGNLAAAMMVRHFINYGHRAVLLVGGATGMIGDPDGKSQERSLKPFDEINTNKTAIAAQYRQIFGGAEFTLADNYEWFKDISYLEFLRDVGKHVPMRQMLGRDFVQKRLSEDGAGISYAEFSYVLIQAYDFLHLNQKLGVTLQVCGSDQWGNSIAGVDLIRRTIGNEVHVWSVPLVINKATGVKFGKTEDGAVWLDPALTSVYKFYQFWLNTDDFGVEDYIKIYTLLPKDQIDDVLQEFRANPSGRLAQKTLAYEVTKIVHGQDQADAVVKATKVLFHGDADLTAGDFNILKSELPISQAKVGDSPVNALVQTGLASSTSEARRFLDQGSIYINNQQINSDRKILASDKIDGENAIIRRGKNSNAVLQITG